MRPVPFPHPQPPPLILTPKDEAIIQAVSQYRFLTAQEITALFYKQGSHTYARSRLSRLAGSKDLTDADVTYDYPLLRFGFPTGRLGNQERIFTLSLTGRQILSGLGIPVSWHFRPSRTFSHSFILHDLTRNRFVVSLLSWAKTKPNLSIESHLAYELAKESASVSIPVQGKIVKVAVVPDALMLVTNTRTNQRLIILLEIDNNSEAQSRFKQHIASRLAYVSSPHFTNTYGNIPYRIVYATQGVMPSAATALLHSMCAYTLSVLAALKKQEYARYIRFTTLNFPTLYEDAQSLFEAPVFYRPDDLSTPVPLLTG
jgi:hypothetical protein